MKPLSQFIAPMMASVAKDPFDSPDWIFETKLDGYRAIAVIDSAGHARIWSRQDEPQAPAADAGRTHGVLILLDHALKVPLKAAILHRGRRIREPRAKQAIGIDGCV